MHCKDTILRTQNNSHYSKLIPNSRIYARLDAVTQRQEKIFSYIASYIDAKGKAGLFDDIKALYKNEKNKREKI